ncbi:hypothetical protein G3480_09400 [Thiorhodococcus mannitoliphagus]|uniref:Uncharacterized protein n=1 Tax=Thiorhodococcus mannitoliphagus TaxID=329406 RepID=A0A6P1DWM1_9GAMM|nr:hypothetical protein [Thiorhodococcus mannitoliphagus]NEX20522.1 hypothetical protein [Thiorhodococcus mannitoliphagus]
MASNKTWSKAAKRLAVVLAVTLLALGCSGSGEDVRIGLCKDLVVTLLPSGAAPVWTEARPEMRRSEELIVHLRFDAAGTGGARKAMQAACHYRHDAVDDTALTLANPMAAYSTSPYRMSLNGEVIGNPRLAQAIKQAMMKQGRELLERAQQGLEGAARALQN